MTKETIYRCRRCEATDLDRGTYGPGPDALVCYSCRAGSKMSIADQIAEQVGMLPIHPGE